VSIKRPHLFLVVSVVFLTLLPWKVAEGQTFKNCRAVRAKYPSGVAINFSVTGTSRAEINRVVYLRNQRLDLDKDGLICENENLQSIGTTTTVPVTTTTTVPVTTTTTVPVTRRTPVSNLEEFVRVYGAAVTTIECVGDYGGTASGTSILNSYTDQRLIDKGIRSTLVTNYWVISECEGGRKDWLSRQVVVRSRAGECVGYIGRWDTSIDVATVYTTCDIPKVSRFTGTSVPKPMIGDVAVIIESVVGTEGTSTQGAIANITGDEILTTAQASRSSGGALFNRDGEFLGIVMGVTGSLTTVIPITKFAGTVYSATNTVAWRT